MKKVFTMFALAVLVACNDTGTGGVEADSTNKTIPDPDNSVPQPAAIPDSLNNHDLDSMNKAGDTGTFSR